MKTFFLILLILSSTSVYGEVISVPITFIEALDSKDTTSSKRFREEYETAIDYGLKLTQLSLEKCGYKLIPETEFYAASDPIQAKERAEKAKNGGSWLIVGPRRSNHYILAAMGAGVTPTVSLMASSDEIATLGAAHLSLVPSNSMMAVKAAKEIKLRLKNKLNKSYISVVREDCLYCKNFADQFDKIGKKLGLTKMASLAILKNDPDMGPILKSIDKQKPSFIFIPNYSIVTSYLISNIYPKQKDLIFVGGDGWGTSFGFVENGRDLENAKGFTVRGNPPFGIGLLSFESGKQIALSKKKLPISSASALSLLKVIDSTKRLLCASKPSNKSDFEVGFQKLGAKYFSSPWGVSVYELSHGSLVYKKPTKAL